MGHSHLPLPFGRRHRSGLHRGESSPRCGARFSYGYYALCGPPPRDSLRLRFDQSLRTRGSSPGVNTYLSAHERRVYLPGLIMDRGLYPLWGRSRRRSPMCCGLVPPDQTNSISVRHPMHLRYSALTERLSPRVLILPPACHTATPFASIRLALGLVIYR
jgi:hypothetical protein